MSQDVQKALEVGDREAKVVRDLHQLLPGEDGRALLLGALRHRRHKCPDLAVVEQIPTSMARTEADGSA